MRNSLSSIHQVKNELQNVYKSDKSIAQQLLNTDKFNAKWSKLFLLFSE